MTIFRGNHFPYFILYININTCKVRLYNSYYRICELLNRQIQTIVLRLYKGKKVGRMDNIDFAKDEPLYTTSVVAKMLKITPDRLRSYDRDLLISSQRKPAGKVSRRLYSQFDIEWLRAIRELIKEHNMSVNSIKAILDILHLNPELKLPKGELGKIYKGMLANPNLKKLNDK